MTINTQKLRRIGTLLDEGYQIEDRSGIVTQAADIIEALDQQVAEYARIAEQTRAEADARIDAQAAEIARLRDGIEEAIRLLGMDRPIDPTDTLRAALSGESKC